MTTAAYRGQALPRVRGFVKWATKPMEDKMKKLGFASQDLTAGQLNAIVKILGGKEGALKLLRGELAVSKPTRSWREQDGVIYFSVTSNGRTGPQCIARSEKKGFRVNDYAKQVFRSDAFHPTKGKTTEIAVLKGLLFSDSDRITEKIREEAGKRQLIKPNAEVACLIREKFSDQELEAMGLWGIVVMHEPIKDSDGDPDLLSAYRSDSGRSLNAYCDRPDLRWPRGHGFAFAVSQVSPQN